MGYEDLTTFTEVEISGEDFWSQTTTRNTATLLERNHVSYVYKDYEAGHFQDFEHDFEFYVDYISSSASRMGFWAVTNVLGNQMSLTDSISLYFQSSDNLVLSSKNFYYDSSISLSLDTLYFVKVYRVGTTATAKIYTSASDRTNDINVVDTLSVTCETTNYRYLQVGHSYSAGLSSDLITGYAQNFDLNEPEVIELADTINLTDSIIATISAELALLSDDVNIADAIEVAPVYTSLNDAYNKFGIVNGTIEDIINDVRTLAEEKFNIINDVRFLKSWQIPGDAGYQSLGKTYVKVYISSIEQTDVDIESISISKVLNSSHSATFLLGRPYDNTKPVIESLVEIKYHIWTLYRGYITQINPTESPDSIKIVCQDEYWKQNKTKQYFQVGHRPQDNFELYYNYISQGLSACGASFGIGSFIPQTMSCFGRGTSDCITDLVTNSGNFGWYYDVNFTKQLWTAGQGDIINLERQEIGKNLGLYQVISHSFRESIENIVNKFRVQMGDRIIRRFNDTGGDKEYATYQYRHVYTSASPGWDINYEVLSQNSEDGYGIFHHPVSQNEDYKDVFTKYSLPFLDKSLESWTDRYPPLVQVLIPFDLNWKCNLGSEVDQDWGWSEEQEKGNLTEGFTIDYEEGTLTFNERIYLYRTNEYGEMTEVRRPDISLQLWKKQYYSNTEDPTDDPTSDISNPLMFFTDKMGDYPETIMENLALTGLGIQIGGWYVSGHTEEGRRIYTYVPSWNDTDFAKDLANWMLSKNCDKRINGTVELTIDAISFYDINLSKRIMIDGVIDNPLNIKSISLNIGSWKATVELQNDRYYKRSVSMQSHGE